jgi:branched-chain amino acid transport system substrate-binding protein
VCSTAENAWFARGFAKKAGLEPVYRAQISLAQPSFAAQCIQARQAGVQVLGLVVDPATTKRIMASCSQQGFAPQYLLSYGEETQDTLKYADDIISSQLQLPFAGVSTAEYRSFLEVWNSYYDVEPEPMALTAWISAKIFERAATEATTLTSAGLISALYKYRNERFGGLTIPLSYGPRGTTNAPCIFYMRGANGRWTAPLSDKPVCW